MQPHTRLISIPNGIDHVPQLLSDLFIAPRKKLSNGLGLLNKHQI